MLLTTKAIFGLFVVFRMGRSSSTSTLLLLLILEVYIDRLHISRFLRLQREVAALALSELLLFLLLKLLQKLLGAPPLFFLLGLFFFNHA